MWSGVTVLPVLGGLRDWGWVAKLARKTQAVWLDVSFRGQRMAAWFENAQFTLQGCGVSLELRPDWSLLTCQPPPGASRLGLLRLEPPPRGQVLPCPEPSRRSWASSGSFS